MDRFNRPSTYSNRNAFSKVIFGYKLPILEVELNELQDIQNEKVRFLLSSIIGNGVIEGATFNYSGGVLVVNAVALVNGYFINLENVSLALAEGEKAYIRIREVIVDGHSTIKNYGNVAGENIDNKILDTDIGIETTKRVQVQFELVKDNSDESYMYLELGTITNSSFSLSAFTLKNNEKVGKMITGILSSIDDLSNKINEESLNNSAITGEITKINNSIAELTQAIGLNNNKITSIEANIQGIISTINSMNTRVSSNSSQITSAKESIKQNTSSIDSVKQKVQGVEGGVQANSKAIADLGERVANTQGAVSGLGAKIQQNTSLANSAIAKAGVNAQEIEKVKQNTYNKSEVDSKDATILEDSKRYTDAVKSLLNALTNSFNEHNHDTRYFRKNLGLLSNAGGDVTDFNQCLTEGQYNVIYGGTETLSNAPFRGRIYGTLLVYVNDGTTHDNSSNWIWQIFYDTVGSRYWRYKVNGGNWQQWRCEYNTLNKPTPQELNLYTKQEVDTKDSNNLRDSKAYTDTKNNEVKQYASTTANQVLESAKSYSDTKLQEAKQYTDESSSLAMTHISSVKEVAVSNQREIQELKSTTQSQASAIESLNGSLSASSEQIAGLRATVNSNDRRIGVLETESNEKANKFDPQPIWQGKSQLAEYDTITPEKAITDCNIGWLLVWSDADNRDYTNNFNYATTLVPKTNLIVGSGTFFCTVPTNEDGTIVVKAIYITETQIKGFKGNDSGNTADAILRQVLAI